MTIALRGAICFAFVRFTARRVVALLLAGSLLILAGCQSLSPEPMPGLQSAGNANASLATDLDAIGRELTAIKPTANPVGQALVDQASASTADAKAKTGDEANALEQAKADDAAALAKQKQADDAAAKIIADKLKVAEAAKVAAQKAAESRMLWILGALVPLGLVIGVAAIVFYEYAHLRWSEYLAIGGGLLSVLSMLACVVVIVAFAVTPLIVTVISIAFVVAVVAVFVVGIIETVLNWKTIQTIITGALHTAATSKVVADVAAAVPVRSVVKSPVVVAPPAA